MELLNHLPIKIETMDDVRGLLEDLEESLRDANIIDHDRNICMISNTALKVLDRAEELYD
tara:strand:- start:1294 stop:1473 length:180 start_codon:yes stop_codon:yes gene_type:complete